MCAVWGGVLYRIRAGAYDSQCKLLKEIEEDGVARMVCKGALEVLGCAKPLQLQQQQQQQSVCVPFRFRPARPQSDVDATSAVLQT